jgi:hypothetical protein
VGGTTNSTLDLNGTVRSESELIVRYREMAIMPEVDNALDEIVNEAIVTDNPEHPPVKIDLEDVELPENIKQIIQGEFNRLITLYKFNKQAYSIFRQWYVDGRLYYHIVIDEQNPQNGIQELRPVDALKLRKVREVSQSPSPDGSGTFKNVVNEYYVYSETGFSLNPNTPVWNPQGVQQQIKISQESIVYVTSGNIQGNNGMVISYLHPAIKPLNQLRMLEDAVVIYRLIRAPARRVFYIETGGLPKYKADSLVRETMTNHKNTQQYDQSTGKMFSGTKFTNMLEDYWIPTRDGKGMKIDTLQEGTTLGEMDDVLYFQKQLFNSLKIPITRIDPSAGFGLGRSTEITRDEVKFSKFIARMQNQFAQLFLKTLKTQLILRRVIAPEEWDMIEPGIKVLFTKDNYFEELKDIEILQTKIQATMQALPIIDQFISRTDVFKQIWRLTDNEIQEKMMEIMQEVKMFGPINPEPELNEQFLLPSNLKDPETSK